MHSLADWITKLVAEDIREINRRYAPVNYGTIQREIESLPDIAPMIYRSSLVDIGLLQKLHSKIRTQQCEAEIWDAIIFHIAKPLPTDIAHDLIDRDVIVCQLGHTRQEDEIQWRLASLVDEALLTLFWDLYTEPNYQVESLQELLYQYPNHVWLLDKWHYWAQSSSSHEKELVFHRWAWEHSGRSADFPDPEEYLEVIADREQRRTQEKARIEDEEKEQQFQLERQADLRRLDLERISTSVLDHSEIELILSSRDPEMLLAIASNPQISIEWIQKLVNCHHVKGARKIREAADSNIVVRKDRGIHTNTR